MVVRPLFFRTRSHLKRDVARPFSEVKYHDLLLSSSPVKITEHTYQNSAELEPPDNFQRDLVVQKQFTPGENRVPPTPNFNKNKQRSDSERYGKYLSRPILPTDPKGRAT